MSQKFSLYNDMSIRGKSGVFCRRLRRAREKSATEKKQWVLSFSGLEGKRRSVDGKFAAGVEAARGIRRGDHA